MTMLVSSNKKFDKWGEYFYLGAAAEYVFPLVKNFDSTKFQADQLKRLKAMKHLVPISQYGIGEYRRYNTDQILDLLLFTKEDKDILDMKIEDLHFKKEVNVIVPYYVATNDLKKHLKLIDPKLELDEPKVWDFWHDDHKFDFNTALNLPRHLGNYDRGMMGTGYTDFTNPSDGSSSLEPAAIEMGTGEFLICLVWEWYNK
jgi:hypothetical protein